MLSLWLGSRYALAKQSGSSSRFLVRMAVSSLALSIALLILVLAIMSGFEHELKTKILNLAPHISISGAEPIPTSEQISLLAALTKEPSITSVELVVSLQALAVKGLATRAIALTGVQPNGHVSQALAPYIKDGALAANDRSILLSEVHAKQMATAVGDSILLMIADDGLLRRQPKVVALTVSGLFNTATELDQQMAVVPLATAQELGGFGTSVSSLQLYTDDVMSANAIAYGLYGSLSSPYRIQDWTVSQGNLYQAIQTSRQMVLLMLVVVVAVAAMNIVTAMTMVVTNKSREIAMLMTMGLAAKRALMIVLIQGLIIALLGIGLGVAIGCALSLAITDIVRGIEHIAAYQFLKSDIYPISYLPTQLLFSDVLSVCVPAFIITLLTAVYPAWRATKILPANALRYDK